MMGLTSDQRERYARHLVLKGLGGAGQRRLLDAHVALVGVGGLGSAAALYLAAAGVGRLTLIEADNVERSNLQRQVIYRDSDIGLKKVEQAEKALKALNPSINVFSRNIRLGAENAVENLKKHHVVIDGTDNFPTRYVINQACYQLNIPWVYGAAEGLAGQLSVFWPNKAPGKYPCYRCLYPASGSIAGGGCATTGVLGMVPGIIGQLQAVEAVKLITGLGQPLLGRLLLYDALDATFHTSKLSADPQCDCGVKQSA